jgi:hypothetical protein
MAFEKIRWFSASFFLLGKYNLTLALTHAVKSHLQGKQRLTRKDNLPTVSQDSPCPESLAFHFVSIDLPGKTNLSWR